MKKWTEWFAKNGHQVNRDTVSRMKEMKAPAPAKSNSQTAQEFIDWLNQTRPVMSETPEPDFGPHAEPEATARGEGLAP